MTRINDEKTAEKRLPMDIRVGVASEIVLGVVFCYAAVAKAVSPAGAEEFVAYFVAPSAAQLVVFVGVAAELRLGCWLISEVSSRRAAWFAAILLAGFTVALLVAYNNRAWTHCGCVGRLGADSLHTAVARNLVLLGMAIYSVSVSERKTAKEGVAS